MELKDYVLLGIEVVVIYLFYNALIKEKYNLKSHIIYSGLAYMFFAIALNIYEIIPVGVSSICSLILPIIIYGLLNHYVLKEKLKKSFLYSLLGIFTIVIFQGVLIQFINNKIILSLVYMTLLLATSVLISKKYKRAIKEYLKKIPTKIVRVFLLISIFLVAMLSFSYMVYQQNGESFDSIELVFLASVFLVLVIFGIFMRFIKYEWDLKLLEEKAVFKETHSDLVDKVHYLGHAYKNRQAMLSSVLELIDMGFLNPDELKELIKDTKRDLLDDEKTATIFKDVKYLDVPNYLLSAALMRLSNEAYKNGVDVDFYMEYEDDYKDKIDLKTNFKDLVDVVGVLFTNAYQAAYYVDKLVYMTLEKKEKTLILTITNKYKRGEGKILKLGESHCVGLAQVFDITEKNEYLDYTSEISEDEYRVTLKIS